MSRQAYEKGMKTRRKVLGDEWVDRAMKANTPFTADFQDLITRYVWDEIWNRPAVSHKVRRMLVIAMLVAMGRWDEYKLHARAALESGDLTEDDLKEVLLQACVYCGVPAANSAFKEGRDIIAELAAKKAKKRK